MAKSQNKEKREKPIRYFDYSLLFLIIFLLCFGLIMLYSTSSYYGSTRFGDAAYYLKKQLFAISLGLVAMLIVSKIPYRFWMKLSGLAIWRHWAFVRRLFLSVPWQRDRRGGSISVRCPSNPPSLQNWRSSCSWQW